MRKTLLTLISALVLGCSLIAPQAKAVLLPKTTLKFVVPQGADPPLIYNFTSFTSSITVTGADLLDTGIELHGRIPSRTRPGYLVDVTSIQLLFTYPYSITTAIGTTGSWAPWTTTINSGKPDYDLVFEGQGPIGEAGGSAPINENFDPDNTQPVSFGLIGATITNDPNKEAENAFRRMQITIKPIYEDGAIERGTGQVPEPGVMALSASLLTMTLIPVIRNRKRRR